MEELSSDDDGSFDLGGEAKFNAKAAQRFSKGILEIIRDDDEEKMRTSSNDI